MAISAFQYDLYRFLAPSCAAALAALLIVSRSRSLRSNPASNVFALYLLASIGYLVANTLEISARSSADNLFWSRVIYLFIPFIPMIWLTFTHRVAGEGRGFSPFVLGVLLIVPIATLGMVFSDSWMSCIWKSIEFINQGPYVISVRVHGPWFAIYALYTYLVAAAGLVIAVRSFTLERSYFRKRSALLLCGVAVPILASLTYLLQPIPGLVKDYTPIAYAIAAFFFFFAIHRLDAFSIVPVAREHLVERMSDGILVFDAEFRIADANRAALEMLGADETLIGTRLPPESEGFFRLPAEIYAAAMRGERTLYRPAVRDGRTACYSVEAIDLPGRLRSRGKLLIMRDETELRDALVRLEELAKTDALTGLSNRRGFSEQAETLMSSALRYKEPFSVAMFDLDHFKRVNDEWGHAVGDDVLRWFARILLRNLRGSDHAGRIGGEEFALVLPRTDLPGARIVCERIRQDFANHVFSDERGSSFSSTVSVGLAAPDSVPYSLETLLAAADSALYKAKAAGRNRTAAFGDPE